MCSHLDSPFSLRFTSLWIIILTPILHAFLTSIASSDTNVAPALQSKQADLERAQIGVSPFVAFKTFVIRTYPLTRHLPSP